MLIDSLISTGNLIITSGDEDALRVWLGDIRKFLTEHPEIIESTRESFKVSLVWLPNPLSSLENKTKLRSFARELVGELKTLKEQLGSCSLPATRLPIAVALEVLSRILTNFYKHMEVMYQEKTHGSAGITNSLLDTIKIKNEYDVQRILYALIKPIFPDVEVEKYADGGYRGVRCDIVLKEYDIWIEVKCTRRSSMSEKSLTEQIGADITHYRSKYRLFFIYDKNKIIKNKDAFEREYTYVEKDPAKDIRMFIVQPITL